MRTFLIYNSYKENQNSCVMKIRKVSLSNNDSNAVSPNIEQENTIDTSNPVTMNLDNSCVTFSVKCIEGSTATEDDASVISEIPVVHSISKINSAESLNRELDDSNDFSAVKDEGINAHNTTQDYLKHHAYISNPEKDGASRPQILPKRQKSNISLARTNGVSTLRCKVLLVFAICCTIGCCLMPIILYYVGQAKSHVATADPEYSHRKNDSAEVSYVYLS